MLGIIIWWFVDAHKWFKGPKASSPYSNLEESKLIFRDQVNIEHQMLGRDDSVIEGTSEGKERSQGSSSGSVEKLREAEADGGAGEIIVK